MSSISKSYKFFIHTNKSISFHDGCTIVYLASRFLALTSEWNFIANKYNVLRTFLVLVCFKMEFFKENLSFNTHVNQKIFK